MLYLSHRDCLCERYASRSRGHSRGHGRAHRGDPHGQILGRYCRMMNGRRVTRWDVRLS